MDDTPKQARFPLAFGLVSGTFRTEEDRARYVSQLIRQVVLTTPGERVMRPEFGCGVRDMLFMPNNPVAANLARIAIYQALEQYLGAHIEVDKVDIDARGEVLDITIRYRLKSSGASQALNMEVDL